MPVSVENVTVGATTRSQHRYAIVYIRRVYNPQICGPSYTVSINERETGAQQAKTTVDRFVGEVWHDGVRERRENVDGE